MKTKYLCTSLFIICRKLYSGGGFLKGHENQIKKSLETDQTMYSQPPVMHSTFKQCRLRCCLIRSRFHIQREARVGSKKGRKFESRVPIQSSLVFTSPLPSGPVRTNQNTRIYLGTTFSYNKRCSLQSELTQIRFPSGYPSNARQLISVRTKTPE